MPETTTHTRGIRWQIHAVALLALAALATLVPAAQAATDDVRVVVTGEPGSGRASVAAVQASGGRVLRRLPIVDGVVARVPAGAIAGVRRAAGVGAVSTDRRFRLHDAGATASAGVTLDQVRQAVGATGAGSGAGIDVALVDSGITPVPGLDARDKVVTGPDFSADAGEEALRHLDAFGHGTHMAGIIAGAGAGLTGVAPDSRLVNVKVADRDGDTSLSRLLAGIDWVVRNRSRDGLDIRVVNLAFGAATDGTYRDDPIAFAVEQAWRHGIVVVAAAGNGGAASTALDSPAVDPYVLAVGAQDMLGTVTRDDDVVADFSSRGSAERSPDLLAPGVGLISARVPAGRLDDLFPNARVGEAGFRGSGTSQSAAVASAAVAVLLELRPELKPDAVKAVLRASAAPLAGADATLQGAGALDLAGAAVEPAAGEAQRWVPARGGGPWRGALNLELAVEHPQASRWSASRWSASRWSASRWSASRWSASRWSAGRWGDASQ